MDGSDHIGQYIARFDEGNDPAIDGARGKWHLVESRIEDRFYTHCGRAFRPIKGTEVYFRLTVDDDERCQRC